MAVVLDMDDELFFADLSKQISQLINDHDDDDQGRPVTFHQSVTFQAYSTNVQPNPRHSFPYEDSVVWKTESRGTGVFIPKSSNWRKKNKQRRIKSYNSISYRQLDSERSTNDHQQKAQMQNSSKC